MRRACRLRGRLHKMNSLLIAQCPNCLLKETIRHCLFKCSHIQPIWGWFKAAWQTITDEQLPPMHDDHWICNDIPSVYRHQLRQTCNLIAHKIWVNRNKKVFHNKEILNPLAMIYDIAKHWNTHIRAQILTTRIQMENSFISKNNTAKLNIFTGINTNNPQDNTVSWQPLWDKIRALPATMVDWKFLQATIGDEHCERMLHNPLNQFPDSNQRNTNNDALRITLQAIQSTNNVQNMQTTDLAIGNVPSHNRPIPSHIDRDIESADDELRLIDRRAQRRALRAQQLPAGVRSDKYHRTPAIPFQGTRKKHCLRSVPSHNRPIPSHIDRDIESADDELRLIDRRAQRRALRAQQLPAGVRSDKCHRTPAIPFQGTRKKQCLRSSVVTGPPDPGVRSIRSKKRKYVNNNSQSTKANTNLTDFVSDNNNSNATSTSLQKPEKGA